MRRWLRETHGAGFELLRHFLRRFFDSDLITAPGQTAKALIGAISLLLPMFPLLVGPLAFKYAHFSQLPVAEPYRLAVRADALWLITLMMSAIGLLTAAQWQSLFPGLRDYRVLGSLPLRAWKIFAAKLTALLLVTTAVIAALNLVPALLFPMISSSRWAIHPALGPRLAAYAAASVGGCYFFFFGMVALQGLLLNLLRPRQFARVTGILQGTLAGSMLVLMVLSFSIQAQITDRVIQPGIARWLPPVWFLGLHQVMSGDRDPFLRALAQRAMAALALAVALSLVTYVFSYRRHRKLLVEGIMVPRRERRLSGRIFDWLVPDPRQQAVMTFLTKTLAGSSQHRLIPMGYGGLGVAIAMSGMLGLKAVVEPARVAAANFIYVHVILLVFLLLGLRHLFSMPMELKANWVFQVTEGEGRREWLRAMDRLLLFWGAAAMLVLPFPLEIRLLGWRAAPESVLFVVFGLLCYEALFYAWDKLPFTCSHMPEKTPSWIKALQLLALLSVLPIVNWILLGCLYNELQFAAVFMALAAAWACVHSARRKSWTDLRLKYEEMPDPAVHSLNLLR